MMKIKVDRAWTRPIANPLFEQSAAYEAWILEWSDLNTRRSRCSIYVELIEEPVVNASKTFDSSEGSTSGRAIAAAFLGAVESLPANSLLIVHTRMAWVAARIASFAKGDVARVLVNSDGSNVAHREIWETINALLTDRNIRIAVPSNDNEEKNKFVYKFLKAENRKVGKR